MTESTTINYARGDDGIVVLTLDDPDQSANTMNAAYVASMGAIVDRLEAERDDITGVIVTSAKRTFFAGGDLNDIQAAGRDRADDLGVYLDTMKDQLRRLETLGRPVVAAINGAALGGGLEIALACHHRIAVDDPKVQIGLPEVTLGLLPGAGGVVRTVRLLGLVDALLKVLLEGRRYAPSEARDIGLVDELVPDRDALVPAARAWIAAHPDAVAPWDAEGYKIPGGGPSSPAIAANLPAFPANLRKQLKGAHYPAPHHILAAAIEGAQVDLANASRIETRYFVDLATGQVAKSMIQAFFFDLQRVQGDRGRPRTEPFRPAKAVVLGAGMMGAGIAHVLAKAGVEVVLKDVSLEAAERGKAHAAALQAKAVERGRTTQAKADELLARIHPAVDPAAAAGVELVIEAVFEDPGVKAAAYAEIEPHLADGALLATNTSSLPVSDLAEMVSAPSDFIGLHFFSPVEKMPLLEIVRGRETGEGALDRALSVAKLLGKTPIVVNDSRGFFTSRVIGTFVSEGIAMLAEGVPAPSIEQAAAQAGYPAPVLQLSDELNLELMRRIRTAARAAGEGEAHPADAVVDRMLDEFSRSGRSAGAGFYAYEDGQRVGLWPGLRDAFGGTNRHVPLEDLKERMLFIEAIEAVRCLDEGVVESVADANIGSIMGIGFPGWTGGVLEYVSGYEDPSGREDRRGPAGFVARARELAERYGDRFEPPASLVERAERGEPYRDAALAAA